MINTSDIGDNFEKQSLNSDLKLLMIKEVSDEILNKQTYRNYLLNAESIYPKTIDFLDSALKVFELEENFENCSELLKFKKEILKKVA